MYFMDVRVRMFLQQLQVCWEAVVALLPDVTMRRNLSRLRFWRRSRTGLRERSDVRSTNRNLPRFKAVGLAR